eukprot:TRINITY_DN15213_c0_g1_i1.p1 TRINITY_DN15213_c0_g1~~TRINITY_DN15213_c0_g1_i1.p1  ORF type:complete len:246 (+),score=61.31 TRINITY_DN15213_c0_g1_i1:169-906(+)
MELFRNYQREFESTVQGIQKKFTQCGSLSGERRKAMLQEIQLDLDSARELVDQMRQTITTFKGGDQLRSTVKVHERELERWVDELRRLQLGVGREVTMPSNESDWTNASADQRTRLLQDRERLGKTSEHINETQRIMIDTQAIGENTLVDLRNQREKLERGNASLDEVDGNISKARSLLNMMKRRVITNKLILVFIIILLLLAEGLIVYFRWIKPLVENNTAPSAPPTNSPVAPPPPPTASAAPK